MVAGSSSPAVPRPVWGDYVAHNLITFNGLSRNAPGAGVVIATEVKGERVSGNDVADNEIYGNGLAGVTIHSHVPGQKMSGDQIVGNDIGRNIGRRHDRAGPAGQDHPDLRTTGILVGASSFIRVWIHGNYIHSNWFGSTSTAGSARTSTTTATTGYISTSRSVSARLVTGLAALLMPWSGGQPALLQLRAAGLADGPGCGPGRGQGQRGGTGHTAGWLPVGVNVLDAGSAIPSGSHTMCPWHCPFFVERPLWKSRNSDISVLYVHNLDRFVVLPGRARLARQIIGGPDDAPIPFRAAAFSAPSGRTHATNCCSSRSARMPPTCRPGGGRGLPLRPEGLGQRR